MTDAAEKNVLLFDLDNTKTLENFNKKNFTRNITLKFQLTTVTV